MASLLRVCFYCGRSFEAAHALANICSEECRRDAIAARPAVSAVRPEREAQQALVRPARKAPGAKSRRRELADCSRCGRKFRAGVDAQRYCSSTCRKGMQRKRRQATLRRAFVERVSIAVLKERDGNTCRICGIPVHESARPPHPEAATIDHIVALAHGGEHSYRNTQLAHHRCNTAKGAGPAHAPGGATSGCPSRVEAL